MVKKKRSTKKNYIPYDIMNTLSEILNNEVLLNEDFSLTALKIKLHDAWEGKPDKISPYVYPKPIREFEEAFELALKSPKEEIFDSLNQVFDDRRSNNEVALSKTKASLFGLWRNIAYGEKRDWDIPWIRETKLGEKFANFAKDEERYSFKGYINQLILLYSAAEKDKTSVVLFRGELQSLLTHDFQVDEESKLPKDKQEKVFGLNKMKGISSMTSLFVPKGYEKWLKEDGSPWKSNNPKVKSPSPKEILEQKLRKISNMSFVSQPVWSVDDVKHLFDDETQQKLKTLMELRKPVHDYVANKEDVSYDDHIDTVIKDTLKHQAIEMTEQGQRAYYVPSQDVIQIPNKEDFKNPVLRYAVFAHELSHSTMHLNKRDHKGAFGSVAYAKEEIIAESTASLLVKDLQQNITEKHDGKLPEKWEKFFTDYYDNATQYGKSWGRKFDFTTLFNTLADSEKKQQGTIDQMMKGVLNAYQTIAGEKLEGKTITAELRESMKNENMDPKKKTNKPSI
jgi:hypothetical protein